MAGVRLMVGQTDARSSQFPGQQFGLALFSTGSSNHGIMIIETCISSHLQGPSARTVSYFDEWVLLFINQLFTAVERVIGQKAVGKNFKNA